jgi:hypothetical protein
VHVTQSRSGGWVILKDEDGTPYFAHARNFLRFPELPRVGRNCEFVVLPPATGTLDRATEIQVLPGRKRFDTIVVIRLPDGVMRIVACGKSDVILGELKMTEI